MIKLKNVSKFYYSKGVVASGFTKLNLELNLGEFVVITGESGSGKSTLLNVISGLDTYEEGEMFINGEETSHYTEKDYEEYRRKYIGNIFQSFNLVNSYTVYQNIELALLINGYKKKEIKTKILDIIKQVDLTKYRNTKVSKLSGGQKQRVAIARALAKDTPVIVADEPTGNLDSRSAESVLKILSEVSKDRLVIVVTHNYDQVEEYATRKIKMHDGKILEDKQLKKYHEINNAKESTYKNITFLNKLRLGLRNTFNIIPKFLLLLLVYSFVTLSVTSEYGAIKKQSYESSKLGYNMYFSDVSDKRIVINKKDKTPFSDEDYNELSLLDNVNKIVKDDLALDNTISLNSDEYYFSGTAFDINNFEGKLEYGRMPNNFDEVILSIPSTYYYTENDINNLLEKEYKLMSGLKYSEILEYKLKVVGIVYGDNSTLFNMGENIYVNSKVMDEIRKSAYEDFSTTESLINSNKFTSSAYTNMYALKPSSKVPKGYIVISADMDYLCKKYSCKNSSMSIKVNNMYFTEELNLKVYRTYTKKTFKNYTGYNDYESNNGGYYINSNDYKNIYNKGFYQSSIFVNDTTKVYDTIELLENMGYKTLYLKDTLVNPLEDALVFSSMFLTLFLTGVTVGLFFVAYFIIKIILKSRNIYFSTIRILGADKKTANHLLNIELFTIFNIAYFLIIGLIVLVYQNIIKVEYINNIIKYLNLRDFILLYAILFIMSFLITKKYAKSLFKSSAMNTYREEV